MEFRNFSNEDKAFFKKWLDWTKENRSYLRTPDLLWVNRLWGKQMVQLLLLGIRDIFFLFNPNGRSLPAKLTR